MTQTIENLSAVFIAINPSDIVLFNFIIESYEGLAEVRTLCPQKGHLVLLAVEDTVASLRELIKDLKSQIDLREIPAPEDLSSDWLLGEWSKTAVI